MQIEMDKLIELGAKFKEKRLAAGLGCDEIAIKIKVSAKTLHALEEAITDSLPQVVFARGFARSYAQELGFKPDEIIGMINEAFPLDSSANINPELTAEAREQSISINDTSNKKLTLILIPLILAILGVAGWFIYKAVFADINTAPISQPTQQHRRPANTPEPNNLPAQPGTNAVATESPAQQSSVASNTPRSDEDSPAQALAAGNASESSAETTPEANEATTEASVSQSENAPAQTEAATSPTAPSNLVPQSNARADTPIPSGKHRVVLFAKYECWVGAEFDDNGRRSFTLQPGQIFVLEFTKNLSLTLGNSGAVDMSYNGNPYEIGGRFREAKILHLP